MDHSTVMVKGLVQLSEAMKLCHTGPPKTDHSEEFDKTWSTGEGNDNPLQNSCLENTIDSMKRLKDITPEDEPPR